MKKSEIAKQVAALREMIQSATTHEDIIQIQRKASFLKASVHPSIDEWNFLCETFNRAHQAHQAFLGVKGLVK